MFGRNSNTLPYMNPFYQHPQNNGAVFSSYTYQQSNLLNFQFQNQTINNNYLQFQQPSSTYHIQQPQQELQTQPNNNSNTQTPDFEHSKFNKNFNFHLILLY